MTRFHGIVAAKAVFLITLLLVPVAGLGGAIALAQRIWTGEATVFAQSLAEQVEKSRSFSAFKASTRGSLDLPLEACPDIAGMPSFIRSAQRRAWIYRFITPWKAFCRHDFGVDRPFYGNFGSSIVLPDRESGEGKPPANWDRKSTVSWNGKAWASDTNIPEFWCHALANTKSFLKARGDVCEEFPDEEFRSGQQDGSNVVNTCLTLAFDNQNHMIGMLWVSTKRQSTGRFLSREYRDELYALTGLLTLLAIGWAVLVFLASRRIASVVPVHLKRRGSTMPFRNDFLLLLARAAAMDHDYVAYIDDRVRRYEKRYARRKGGDWAFFWRILDLVISLLSRRVTYAIRRLLVTITKGTKTVWRRALKVA